MKKKIAFLLFVFSTVTGFSQQPSINNYKYIIVPSQFTWLSTPDQYKVNSLTKFLFEKHGGFTVFLDTETFPEDLAKNRCMALVANVTNNSGFFTTKNTIELKNCNNQILFTSKVGKSKEKEYQKAFHEAIRNAFESVKNLNYKYNGTNNIPTPETPVSNPTKPNSPEIVQQNPNNTKTEVLYAQAISNGFQLVNTKPQVVFKILQTSKKNLYILKDKKGILFKKENIWVAEYYYNNNLTQKQYIIKF